MLNELRKLKAFKMRFETKIKISKLLAKPVLLTERVPTRFSKNTKQKQKNFQNLKDYKTQYLIFFSVLLRKYELIVFQNFHGMVNGLNSQNQ